MTTVKTAAVLGAGVMGAQIAAHLANAGVPTLLLDVSADAAREGLERGKRLKPDPFFTSEGHTLVSTGSLLDLSGLQGRDWIIEAIVEQVEVKRPLLERLEPFVTDTVLLSSNTSGIPIASLAAGRSDQFRRRWLGTHFFNPPRYLPLLEIIPTSETDASAIEAIAGFADRRLGKGVVVAKDTPGFIANRIGLFGLMQVFRALAGGTYTVEEVDAITGPATGRPKSATFRTMDLAGLDILAHVTRGLAERLDGDERREFTVPPVVEELLRRGWTGTKSGRGFYRKDPSGEIHALKLDAFTYEPAGRPRLPALDAARSIEDTAARLKVLFTGEDRVGEFLRATLAPTLLYAARIGPGVAYSPDDVDRAMRWGFGWELGPFETLRAIGVDAVAAAIGEAQQDPADILSAALPASTTWGTPPGGADPTLTRSGGGPTLKLAKASRGVLRRNPGASLVDLGDGVLAVEFHTKLNTIGGDTIEMLGAGVKEAEANFQALVVGNDATNFSAGANLMLLLLEAQEGNWDDVDLMVRAFQRATMGLKHAGVPVIVCPAGLTLGGGCEIALHAAHVQAAAETYMGLVEVGVGLIPAGGGTKELLARAMEELPPAADALPFVQRVFETIGFARVSTSGPDARRIGLLRGADGITMNRERLLSEGKAAALARVAGFVPAQPRTAIPVGGPNTLAALKLGVHMAWRAGRISDHDALIGRKLAWILSGGGAPNAGRLTEGQLLDLEREAFLSLCGEPRTLERIAHTLKTGKTLRN